MSISPQRVVPSSLHLEPPDMVSLPLSFLSLVSFIYFRFICACVGGARGTQISARKPQLYSFISHAHLSSLYSFTIASPSPPHLSTSDAQPHLASRTNTIPSRPHSHARIPFRAGLAFDFRLLGSGDQHQSPLCDGSSHLQFTRSLVSLVPITCYHFTYILSCISA